MGAVQIALGPGVRLRLILRRRCLRPLKKFLPPKPGMTSRTIAPPESANVRRGILWMLVTTVFFVSLDATAKYLTKSLPVVEIVWGRYLFHTIYALIWAGTRLPAVMSHARYGMQ